MSVLTRLFVYSKPIVTNNRDTRPKAFVQLMDMLDVEDDDQKVVKLFEIVVYI